MPQKLTRSLCLTLMPFSLSLSLSRLARCAGHCVPGLCGASHAATVAQLWHCPQLTERIHRGACTACCWCCASTGCRTRCATAAGEILCCNANLQQAWVASPAPAPAPAHAHATDCGSGGFAEQWLAKFELIEYGRYHAHTDNGGRRSGSRRRETASLQFGYER